MRHEKAFSKVSSPLCSNVMAVSHPVPTRSGFSEMRSPERATRRDCSRVTVVMVNEYIYKLKNKGSSVVIYRTYLFITYDP